MQFENSNVVCWLKSVYVFHDVQRNKYTKKYIYIIYVYIYYIKPIYSLIIDGNKINKDTSMKVDKNKLFFIVIAKPVRATTMVI